MHQVLPLLMFLQLVCQFGLFRLIKAVKWPPREETRVFLGAAI